MLMVHANSNHSIQTQKQYKCVHFSMGLVSFLFTQNACNTNVVTHLFWFNFNVQCLSFQNNVFFSLRLLPPPHPRLLLLSLCSLCLRSAHFCCLLKTVSFCRSFISIFLILIFPSLTNLSCVRCATIGSNHYFDAFIYKLNANRK